VAPRWPASPSMPGCRWSRCASVMTGFVAPTTSGPEALERARQGRGWAALLVVRLDNGAMCKSLHGFLEASQQAWVRIHGDAG
jgi:hypothetical protein